VTKSDRQAVASAVAKAIREQLRPLQARIEALEQALGIQAQDGKAQSGNRPGAR